MSEPDIHITSGKTFTLARVGNETVAVKWSDSETAHYVSAGTGPASKFDSEREAMGRLLFIAMQASGGGAASITTQQEGPDSRG